MDSETSLAPKQLVRCSNCGWFCSLSTTFSPDWIRSVKRKLDEIEDGNRTFMPAYDSSVARVQIENECLALREMVSSQQLSIQDLYVELEAERNASSSAANEAMSMILRLQREKAEIQMESRQFKRFAEEKMAHDLQELLALEDLLYKREQAIQSLSCEVQAYKHRMLSYGFTEAEVEGSRAGYSRSNSVVDEGQPELPTYDYPPLKCNPNETNGSPELDNEVEDVEKFAFGETPQTRDQLKNLEIQISQMERNPSNKQIDKDFSNVKNVLEKVIVGHSPRRSRHSRRFSMESLNSLSGYNRETSSDFTTDSPKYSNGFKKMEQVSEAQEYSNSRKMENTSENEDDMSDRVYTIDSVHNSIPNNGTAEVKSGGGTYEDFITTPRESFNRLDLGDPNLMKLYMRLQALEADRESMRQAIISMRTDKAQLVLLREIAQQLCKEMTPEKRMPMRKASFLRSFSIFSAIKWIVSFVFWKRKTRRNTYLFGLSSNNVGLLILLEKGPRQWRCLTRTQI